MAKGNSGQTLEKLYIELGLDLSQLQADILAADKTVTENLGRLNREKNVIKLRMEADVASLDRVKDATKILEIQEKALNQQLAITKDRMNILLAAYAQVASNANSTALAVNKAEQAFLREKIAVGQLEQQLKSLASQKIPAPTGGLLGGYNNIKVNVSSKINELAASFDKLRVATSSADGAVTTILSTIGKIPTPVGKAVVAIGTLVGLPVLIKNIESSLLDMAKPAIAAGDSFYVMSRGLQLSIADMAKFSTIAKVTGIDVNEASNAIRRFSMQITKSGERNKLLAETMKRYGAELYDETGHLKNALDLSIELSKALKSAQAEGNGAAFRDIVGGKFWSGDVVTWLEDLEGNIEQAKKVVKNGLANPTWAHAIQGEINTLNAQTAQLGSAFSSALMPVADEIVPKLQEQFGKLTSIIADNKENIKFLGEAMALPVRMLHEFTDGLIALSTAIDEAKAEGTTLGKMFSAMGDYRDDLAALMKVAPTTAFAAMTSPIPNATNVAIAAYRDEIDAWKHEQKAVADAAKEQDRIRQEQSANSQALNKETLEQMKKLEGELEKTEERRIKNAQDAEDIIFGIRHSSYEKQLRDIENWENAQLKSIEELKQAADDLGLDTSSFVLEEVSVYELANAKRIQAEQEKEQKLAEIRQRITAGEQTELEKRIADIEREKQTWIQAGMDKAEAEQLAQKQLNDYLKNSRQELSDKVQSLYQTELESRLSQIEKEKQAWIDKCADEVKATELAEQQKADAQRAAAMSVLRQQAQEYEVYQKGGYAGLRAYKAAELERQGVNSDYLYMTPQQLSDFQKASQVADKSMLPNFMTDHDRYEHQQQMQNWQDWRTQQNAEYDKQNYAITNGVKTGMSEALGNTPLTIEIGKNNAEEGHTISVSPDGGRYTRQDDKYSYDKNGNLTQKDSMTTSGMLPTISEPLQQYTESLSELPQAVQGITESFSELPTAVQNTTESLGEFSTTIQEIIENIPEIEPTEIPEIDSSGIPEIVESLSQLPTAVQGAAGSLNELPTAVQGVMEQISAIESQQLPQDTELPSILSEVAQSFSQLPTVIQTASDSLNGLPVMVSGLKENLTSEVSQLFSPMSESLTSVTVKFSDLGSALDSFLSQLNSASINQNQSQPIEVNNTISIDEAHAWDYDHIQELAEKVADIIEPILLRSIGGDSNSY